VNEASLVGPEGQHRKPAPLQIDLVVVYTLCLDI